MSTVLRTSEKAFTASSLQAVNRLCFAHPSLLRSFCSRLSGSSRFAGLLSEQVPSPYKPFGLDVSGICSLSGREWERLFIIFKLELV